MDREDVAEDMLRLAREVLAADEPQVHRYVRFEDGRELFHTERNGTHYLLYLNLSYATHFKVMAKGGGSGIRRKMDMEIEDIEGGVSESESGGNKIETERMDSKAKQRLRTFFVDPGLSGKPMDWDKNTPEVGDSEEDEQADFHRLLQKQVKAWKGSRSNLNVTNHRYWPKFHAIVVEAVKKKYGGTVTVYRGIHGDQAEEALRGRPIKIYKFNSWTFDKGYAQQEFGSERKQHGVQEYWMAVKKNYTAEDVVFAPVMLPDYAPNPRILMPFKRENEAVIQDTGGTLKGYKVYKKSRKKLAAGSVPRTLWHLSNHKFRRFSLANAAQGILWFAKDKNDLVKNLHGANINSRRPVYLYEVKTTARNPAGWDEYDKLMLAQIEDMGYDSIDLDDDFVVFDPKHVRIVGVETLSGE